MLKTKAHWSQPSQQQITVPLLHLLFMAASALWHSVSHCT